VDILSSINPLSAVVDLGAKLIDNLIPDKNQATALKIKLLELQQSGDLAQLAADTDIARAQAVIDQNEANNKSIFVAGWRPFVGWVCGFALAYNLMLQPLLQFALVASGVHFDITSLPKLDSTELTTILFGMLGLGAARTVEKVKGINAGS
jgi:Holin of 3TMs, for gene-transfer release